MYAEKEKSDGVEEIASPALSVHGSCCSEAGDDRDGDGDGDGEDGCGSADLETIPTTASEANRKMVRFEEDDPENPNNWPGVSVRELF